jgi:hypothetical protein
MTKPRNVVPGKIQQQRFWERKGFLTLSDDAELLVFSRLKRNEQ